MTATLYFRSLFKVWSFSILWKLSEFRQALKDCHNKGDCILVTTCWGWQVERAVGDLVVGSQRPTNKLKKNSGALPGTLRAMYITIPSGSNFLSFCVCGLRSAVRGKYNDEDKVYKISDVMQAFLNINLPMLVPGKQRREAHTHWSFYKGPWQNSSL